MDGILYTIVGQETWVLRQLILDDRIRDVQPDVLRQNRSRRFESERKGSRQILSYF